MANENGSKKRIILYYFWFYRINYRIYQTQSQTAQKPVRGTGATRKTFCGNPTEQLLPPNTGKGNGRDRENMIRESATAAAVWPCDIHQAFRCFKILRVLVCVAPYRICSVRLPTFSAASASAGSLECFHGRARSPYRHYAKI